MCEDEDRWSFGDPCFIYHGKIIPQDFPYVCILVQGRPCHYQDAFSCRHPQMERRKRAKIFAPFDALDGYSDCIASKRVQYCGKKELDDAEKEELNRRLTILHNLTFNSRMARANHVHVRVKYFVPCTDPNSFSYGRQGRYIVVAGVVRNVDMDVRQAISVDDIVIRFDDIISIEAEERSVFEQALDG